MGHANFKIISHMTPFIIFGGTVVTNALLNVAIPDIDKGDVWPEKEEPKRGSQSTSISAESATSHTRGVNLVTFLFRIMQAFFAIEVIVDGLAELLLNSNTDARFASPFHTFRTSLTPWNVFVGLLVLQGMVSALLAGSRHVRRRGGKRKSRSTQSQRGEIAGRDIADEGDVTKVNSEKDSESSSSDNDSETSDTDHEDAQDSKGESASSSSSSETKTKTKPSGSSDLDAESKESTTPAAAPHVSEWIRTATFEALLHAFLPTIPSARKNIHLVSLYTLRFSIHSIAIIAAAAAVTYVLEILLNAPPRLKSLSLSEYGAAMWGKLRSECFNGIGQGGFGRKIVKKTGACVLRGAFIVAFLTARRFFV